MEHNRMVLQAYYLQAQNQHAEQCDVIHKDMWTNFTSDSMQQQNLTPYSVLPNNTA